MNDHSFKFDENGKNFSKRVENNEGKGEIALKISPFPKLFSKDLYSRNQGLSGKGLTHYQTTSCRLFQTADDNFRFDKNGRKLSKRVENTVGKGEIAHCEQFLLFPVFSKGLFPRGIKRCHCVGTG